MFQMKYEDISAESQMNIQNEDEIAEFFSYYDSKNKQNKYQYDLFADPQSLTFKKEESFFQQNSLNQNNIIADSYLNQEENYFYFNKEDIMENENEVNRFEMLYPNISLFNQKSAWRQESMIINNEFKQQNILVDNNFFQFRNISTISWNKLQKYIQISYNLNEQCSIEKKISAKQVCSEQSIETAESNLSESQSIKNHENSITDQEEFSNVSNENSSINASELSLQHYLDQSSPLNFEYEQENSNEFITSNFFIFKESNQQQKTAYLQSSILSESLLLFLTNNTKDIQKTVLSSQQFSSGFACLKNEQNKRKLQQIYEYIFSNIENFTSGQIASNELFSFETIDGFNFTLQVFQQIFPIRGLNNELQGCAIKNHMIIPDSIISEIKIFRKNKQEQENQTKQQEKEEQQSSNNIISKEELLQKEIQNSVNDDKFTKDVKKFLYKFKYISKQRNQKQQKKLQDLYPSKVCKYRALKQ